MNPPRVIEIGDLVLVPGHEPSDGVLSLKKYPLINYEKALLGQATGGKFPSVTFIERKQMSTKTSFKRIALVAASALAIAGFSAMPAHAAAITASAGGTVVNSISTPVRTSNTTWSITINATITTAATYAAGDTVAQSAAIGGNGTSTATVATVAASHTITASEIVSAHVATYDIAATLTAVSASIANVLAAVGTVDVILTAGTIAAGAATNATVPALSTTGAFGTATATGGTNSALTAGVNGQATVRFINGTGDTSYTVTSSGVGSILSATPTTTAVVLLNGTTAAGGVSWTPVTNRQNLDVLTTSAVAGTQTLTFQPIGALGAPGIPVTATITWGSIAGLSTGGSIIRQAGFINGDAQTSVTPGAAFSTTVDAAGATVSKTAGTNASTIEVMLLNSDGTAAQQGNKVTATVKSGPGLITVNTTNTTTAGLIRAQTATTSGTQNMAYVYVTADGAAGVGVIEISVTDAITGTTTVLGTRSVTFTGSVTTIAVASTNFNIGAAGKTTGAATGARDASLELGNALAADATLDTMPAFVINTTDGTNAVSIASAGVPSVKSADTTVVSGGVCVLDTTTSTNRKLIGQGGSAGFYNCSFTGGANAASGKSVVLTFSTPSTTAGVNLTTTATVTIGGTTVGSEKITTDATSYSAGQAMVVTITAKDSAGNPVADGTKSPAVTANKALGTSATALAAGFYAGGSNANAASPAKSSLFAPSLGGDFILKATGTDTAKTALTATATVEGDSASSLALDAANAATDAANNAYDEAQNATQAASDALAAVTALSAQVEALIATVKSLAAMVAKIKAKVKA